MQHCILLVQRNAQVVRIGKKGNGPGEFHYPRSILLLGRWALVADSWNHRIQAFDRQSWEFRFAFGSLGAGDGQFFCPSWIRFLDPWLIVADTNNARLSFHSENGEFLFASTLEERRFPRKLRQAEGMLEVQYEDGEWQRLEFV